MSGLNGRGARACILLVVLVSLVGCDQATKQYAVEHFKGRDAQSYLGDTFRIQYAENEGAFLSLGDQLPPPARFLLLTLFNAVILVGVSAYLFLHREVDLLSLCGLGLILAGGVGNLIDRVMLGGVVIDFLNVGVGPVRTGIFNVADMAITTGFVLLVPLMVRPNEPPAGEAGGTVPAEGS